MQAARTHAPTVPRGPLLAVAVLLACALLAAAAVRWSGAPIRAPDAAVAAARSLHFSDRADGAVLVTDASSGAIVATITGEAGFLRGTLRGLARERRRMGIGDAQPFDLLGRTDGRLTLLDPATRRAIDLESFGPVQAGVFARLLAAPPSPTAPERP